MRMIRYGGAASVDGYIAGPSGEADWIPMDPDIDFGAMMTRYDTYLMGRRTYEAMAGYGGTGGMGEVWVFSRTLRPEDHPAVTIIADDVERRVRALRERPGKDIALYGGGNLFRSLLALGLVDEIEIAYVPVLLGGGIPLLATPAERRSLSLKSHRIYPKTGTVLVEYQVNHVATRRTGSRRASEP